MQSIASRSTRGSTHAFFSSLSRPFFVHRDLSRWTIPSHKPGVAQVREVTRRQRQNWRPGLNSLRGGQGLIEIGENVVDMLQPD